MAKAGSTGSLTISATTTLAISGGWSTDFGTQSTSPAKTKIDARFQGPVFVVTAAGTTIDPSWTP